MTILCLINPTAKEKEDRIAAELEPNKYVKIFEERIQKRLDANGIIVSREFMEKHKTGWKVSSSDGPALFAIAFKECYFERGLRQQGYYWNDEEIEKSDLPLANRLIHLHHSAII